ncbi:Major facilitator superfamily domain,Acetyl-coenzyme A transporter 1 [Cinara cedri]|uniref:Major facilitator superfamily domain,Acetyl-coenzyme A transporter 1 n=1 Tax=Cinara cedri TaxID=506608 RepID=A0A5E4M7S1_9HEMI|nr:Major facilitator superfamily domain,Acetyl-coenzyme A transporter 1 [Cinara cedri]
MVKCLKDGHDDSERSAMAPDSTATATAEEEKPNLNGDWHNVVVLVSLYTMQGVPLGLTSAMQIILQGYKSITYADQALFSIVLWPYSLKLLWAPVVDAIYIQRVGRRKSWLIPVQYTLGACLLYFGNNMDDLLPESGKPNINMIVCVFFIMNLTLATQDIVVDSWALTMLKKNNVSYASTCNYVGAAAGMCIGSVCPILLASEDFCNRYLRITPGIGAIMSIKSFSFFWGMAFFLITTLIVIVKRETDNKSDEENDHTNVFRSFARIWDILKIPRMKILVMAVLTTAVGSSATDSVANLKLIDAGVSKDDIMLIITTMYILKIVVPLFLTKYTTGQKTISFYLILWPFRLFWSLPFAMLVYYTPTLIKNSNGVVYVPMYYYFLIGSIFAINESLSCLMYITLMAFFSRISDPRFGGTYMTLLCTVRSTGLVVPHTTVLKMVDVLTFYKCSNDFQNNSTGDLKNMSYYTANDGKCTKIVDGYYVEVIVCLLIGFVWYGIFKGNLKKIESKNRSYWLVDVNDRFENIAVSANA